MAAPRRPKKKAKPPEHSVTLIASEDSRPIGWMPPSFPPDYVAGSIAPFFLAGSYIGATPLLPMIDLSLTKQGGVPGKGRPKVEMTNSAFGAVYSKIDGTPHPVVDTAGYAPFGFVYRHGANPFRVLTHAKIVVSRPRADRWGECQIARGNRPISTNTR